MDAPDFQKYGNSGITILCSETNTDSYDAVDLLPLRGYSWLRGILLHTYLNCVRGGSGG